MWSDADKKYADARIIFLDTEPFNWTWDEQAGQYYWHRFYASQPDLNFDNPKVQEEMFNIARFWLILGLMVSGLMPFRIYSSARHKLREPARNT